MEHSEELHRQIILDHGQHPHHFGKLASFTHHAFAKNPYCGDAFDVFIQYQNGYLTTISFSGDGCLASKASASIMTDLVIGKKLEEVRNLIHKAQEFILNSSHEKNANNMGDFKALISFKQFPLRQHCVLLSWNILDTILKNLDA